jgi:hypothetical protein
MFIGLKYIDASGSNTVVSDQSQMTKSNMKVGGEDLPQYGTKSAYIQVGEGGKYARCVPGVGFAAQ